MIDDLPKPLAGLGAMFGQAGFNALETRLDIRLPGLVGCGFAAAAPAHWYQRHDRGDQSDEKRHGVLPLE
ncbi:MAG: hypothetical protein AB7U97_14485 [Pirellulales bacterium]